MLRCRLCGLDAGELKAYRARACRRTTGRWVLMRGQRCSDAGDTCFNYHCRSRLLRWTMVAASQTTSRLLLRCVARISQRNGCLSCLCTGVQQDADLLICF